MRVIALAWHVAASGRSHRTSPARTYRYQLFTLIHLIFKAEVTLNTLRTLRTTWPTSFQNPVLTNLGELVFLNDVVAEWILSLTKCRLLMPMSMIYDKSFATSKLNFQTHLSYVISFKYDSDYLVRCRLFRRRKLVGQIPRRRRWQFSIARCCYRLWRLWIRFYWKTCSDLSQHVLYQNALSIGRKENLVQTVINFAIFR